MAESVAFQMPKKTYTVEFFVGVFGIIGVGCLGYLALNIAGMKLFSTGVYDVTAEFDDVSGLELGAAVEIAGVPVGEVKEINLSNIAARITLQIKNAIPVRDDDIAIIRTKGIIGDKYVKIVPGSSDQFIGPNGQISETESAVNIEDMIGKIIHRME